MKAKAKMTRRDFMARAGGTICSISLPLPHGAPLRALIPDLYFYKSAKWLQGIKFSSRNEPGYWQSAGLSGSGDPWE